MSLDTIIHAGLSSARRNESLRPALVLMGGGARTAYQVGVLRGLAAILGLSQRPGLRFPFSILVGTSAGALNASFLAGAASKGLSAFQELSDFWGGDSVRAGLPAQCCQLGTPQPDPGSGQPVTRGPA